VTRRLPRLHAVTTHEVLARPGFACTAVAADEGGPLAVHLRDRSAFGRHLSALARRLTAPPSSVTVLLNDRVDVALAEGLGVHLPADGLPIAAARRLLGTGPLVGRSTHSVSEVRKAFDEGADYVFLGPVWSTASHPNRPGLGLDVVAAAVTDAAGPVIAIGGITTAQVPACLEAGAYGVAAIRAIWDRSDPAASVAAFRVLLPSLDD